MGQAAGSMDVAMTWGGRLIAGLAVLAVLAVLAGLVGENSLTLVGYLAIKANCQGATPVPLSPCAAVHACPCAAVRHHTT